MNTHGKFLRIGCLVVAVTVTTALSQTQPVRRTASTNERMTTMQPVSDNQASTTRVASNARDRYVGRENDVAPDNYTAREAPVIRENDASRDPRVAANRVPARRTRDRGNGKQEAKIDSLDVELRHDGSFWAVEIEYEVELEGIPENDVFFLGIEVMEDDRPVLDGEGQPITFVLELVAPTKYKKAKREYEGRTRIRVHKDWVGDDDDLELKASLVRDADGRVFDVEDEDADLDRPGPFLHIGAYGVGISIPL